MSLKRTSNLGAIFYYDGHTRNPCRWLLPAPSATDTLCLYSLHVPHTTAVSSAPTSLVLNLVNATDERERRLLDILRRRLFPGCLISIPVKYWTRTTDEVLAPRHDAPSRGVLDDYLRRERALKTVVFGSLHLRPAFFSDPDFPRLVASDDPLAGPVSGMIEERIRKLEDSVFPLDTFEASALTF